MSWNSAFFILPILYCSSMYGLVEHSIDEKKPLSIVFSKSSHNRISVDRGGVERIFGDENYFNISIDRTTGNAFVNLLRDVPAPVTLTVITSSGLIQDLLVASSDQSSEYLILKEEEENLDELLDVTANFHDQTVEFLNSVLEGRIPPGYKQKQIENQANLQLPRPLISSQIKVYERPFEEIHVYTIKNTGKSPIIIDSNSLKKDQASWVFLNAHELKAKEEALCLISYPRNPGNLGNEE
jgi:hypothetical protein